MQCRHTCWAHTATTPCDKQLLSEQLHFPCLEEHVQAFLVSQLTHSPLALQMFSATFCCSNSAVSLKIALKLVCDQTLVWVPSSLDSIIGVKLHCVDHILSCIVFNVQCGSIKNTFPGPLWQTTSTVCLNIAAPKILLSLDPCLAWIFLHVQKKNRGAFVMTHAPDLNVGLFFLIKNVLYLHAHQPTSPFNYYIGFAPNFLIPSFQINNWTKGPLCLPVLTFPPHRSAPTVTGREISGLVNCDCYAVMFIFTSNSKVISTDILNTAPIQKCSAYGPVSALTAVRLMLVSIFSWPSATGFYTYCLLPSVSYYCVALSLSYLQRYCGWDGGKHFFSSHLTGSKY